MADAFFNNVLSTYISVFYIYLDYYVQTKIYFFILVFYKIWKKCAESSNDGEKSILVLFIVVISAPVNNKTT